MVNSDKLGRLITQGFTAYVDGDDDTAESLLTTVLEADHDQADALHILGLIQHRKGLHDEARNLIERATIVKPDNSQYFNNLALVSSAAGDHEAGLRAAKKSVFLNPESAENQTTRGLMLHRCGRLDEAASAYRVAIHCNSRHLQPRLNLGALLMERRDFEASANEFSEAMEAEPHSIEAAAGLAKSLIELSRYVDAIECLRKHVNPYANRLSIQLLLAKAYLGSGETDRAVQILEQSVESNPDNASAWNDLGYALRDQGELARAENAFLRALDIESAFRAASENLSQLYLSQGRFETGWALYHKRQNGRAPPVWLSDTAGLSHRITGKELNHLYTWTEQGLGDEILQSSLIGDLSQQVPQLTVRCSERLLRLFKHSFPSVTFTSEPRDIDNAADVAGCPLIDTASVLRPNSARFPETHAYLCAPKTESVELKKKYLQNDSENALVVGLSWQSGHKLFGSKNTIPLDQWKPIFDTAKQIDRPIIFVPMQFGAPLDSLDAVLRQAGISFVLDSAIDHGGDMLDVACQVAAADIVLTTSTTTAQLAGALGQATIHMTADGLACGWYWMAEGSATPWHPSMHLIRPTNGIDQQLANAAEAFAQLALKS